MKIVYLKDTLEPDDYLELASFYYSEDVGFKTQSLIYSTLRIEEYDKDVCGEIVILALEGLLSRLKYNATKGEENFNKYIKQYVNNIRIIT